MQAHVLPVEAGHVGADNVGVILAEEPDKAPEDEVWLIVDVGTNGELLLGNCKQLFSASSPTGPAFEGAQIRHGIRAVPGRSSASASTRTRWRRASRSSGGTSGTTRGGKRATARPPATAPTLTKASR